MRLALSVGALAALGVCACTDVQPPHALVAITDPDGIAVGATEIAIGIDAADLKVVALAEHTFPATVTLTSSTEGVKTVFVEARDAGGLLARAHGDVDFARASPPQVELELGRPCDVDADACDDGIFCNGAERCELGRCQRGDAPCPAPPFSCVTVTCLEEAGACDVSVSHNVCEPEPNDGGVPEPTYCDVTEGCRPGVPCYDDTDCADESFCNGAEICLAGRCVGGVPPERDDGNPCTLDGCSDAAGGEIVRYPLSDGDPCFIDESAGVVGMCLDAVCLSSVCGDGYLNGVLGEECDDTNANDLDGCQNDCTRPVFEVQRYAGGTFCDGATLDRIALGNPEDFAAAPDGTVVWVDDVYSVVRRYHPQSGLVTRVAGTGIRGFSVDGTRALDASLGDLKGVAVDPGSGRVFFSESDAHMVRYVDDQGALRTAAGTGELGAFYETDDARATRLIYPSRLAFAAPGVLLISDSWGAQFTRRVIVDGPDAFTGDTVLGGGSATIDGSVGTSAAMSGMSDLVVDADGNVLSTHGSAGSLGGNGVAQSVRQPDGTYRVSRVAGMAGSCSGAPVDGADALATPLCSPVSIAPNALGHRFCLVMTDRHQLWCVGQDGLAHHVAGNGATTLPSDTPTDPLAAPLGFPERLFALPDGSLFVAARVYSYLAPHLVRISADGSSLVRVVGNTREEERVCGVGGPAVEGHLDRPWDTAPAPDGGLLVRSEYRIFHVLADGSFVELPAFGTGKAIAVSPSGRVVVAGYYGELGLADSVGAAWVGIGGDGDRVDDNVPLVDAALNDVIDLLMPDDDTILILEREGQRLRRATRQLDDTWLIDTLAGDREPDPTSPDGQALQTSLYFPESLALGPAGQVWIADGLSGRARRLEADGTLVTVATFGGAATGIAIDAAGNAQVATDEHRVWLLGARDDGVVPVGTTPTLVVGSGEAALRVGLGEEAHLMAPRGLSLAPDGSLLAIVPNAHAIVRVRRLPN